MLIHSFRFFEFSVKQPFSESFVIFCPVELMIFFSINVENTKGTIFSFSVKKVLLTFNFLEGTVRLSRNFLKSPAHFASVLDVEIAFNK